MRAALCSGGPACQTLAVDAAATAAATKSLSWDFIVAVSLVCGCDNSNKGMRVGHGTVFKGAFGHNQSRTGRVPPDMYACCRVVFRRSLCENVFCVAPPNGCFMDRVGGVLRAWTGSSCTSGLSEGFIWFWGGGIPVGARYWQVCQLCKIEIDGSIGTVGFYGRRSNITVCRLKPFVVLDTTHNWLEACSALGECISQRTWREALI